jgi:hypothetical protein
MQGIVPIDPGTRYSTISESADGTEHETQQHCRPPAGIHTQLPPGSILDTLPNQVVPSTCWVKVPIPLSETTETTKVRVQKILGTAFCGCHRRWWKKMMLELWTLDIRLMMDHPTPTLLVRPSSKCRWTPALSWII